MPAGLQVFNDSNIVQIDSNYSNSQLVAKGTATTVSTLTPFQTQPNGTHYYYLNTVQVSFTATAPFFAVSCPVTVCVISTVQSGSTWTITVATPTTPATFEWFLFDYAASSGSNVGMQVFNASGTLVFDAQNKYLRQAGAVFDITPTYSIGNLTGYTNPVTYTYSLTPGKKYAVGAMLVPFNTGNTKWDSGQNTIPSTPHCQAFGFGGFVTGTGYVQFTFVHVVLPFNYVDYGVGGQVFGGSNVASGTGGGDQFGFKQYGGIFVDVTNY